MDRVHWLHKITITKNNFQPLALSCTGWRGEEFLPTLFTIVVAGHDGTFKKKKGKKKS